MNSNDDIEFLNLEKVLHERPPELDFVIPGLPRGSIGLLVGIGGVGKSLFCLDLLSDLCIGNNVVGLNPENKLRNVYYLSLEDSLTVLHHRLHFMYRDLDNKKKKLILKKSKIATVKKGRLNVGDVNSNSYEILKNFAEECDLFIIDTFSRLHSLDENSNMDMSIVISNLEMVAKNANCAILVVHHVAKFIKNDGSGSSHLARGASSITDNVRFVISLTKSKNKLIKLNFEKVNYLPSMSPIQYQQDEHGRFSKVINLRKTERNENGILSNDIESLNNDIDNKNEFTVDDW